MNDFRIDFDELFSQIPPIASPTAIAKITSEIRSFFETAAADLVPCCQKHQYFLNRKRIQVPLVRNDDLKTVLSLFRQGSPQVLDFLEQHRDVCRAFTESVTVSLFGEITDRVLYSQFVSLAFYSGNCGYLRYLLVVLKFPELKALQRPRPSRGMLDLTDKSKMPAFYVTPSTRETARIQLLLNGRKIAHFTAFTCNLSSLFVGYSNGEISIFSLPLEEGREPVSIYSKFLVERPYSLCWAKSTLWIFTETNIMYADLSSLTINLLMKKVPDLKFPVVTDGHYLYSLSFGLLRFRLVSIFSLSQQTFVFERKVKLDEYGFDKQLPVFTNGTFMTFSEWTGTQIRYRQFSLLTGELVKSVYCAMDDVPFCWCSSPYTGEYFSITRNSIRSYDGGMTLANWLIGVQVPDFKEPVTPQQALYYCVYHGIDIPHDDALEYLIDILKVYIANENIQGIVAISSMILATGYPILTEIFEGSGAYEKAPNSLKRFLVFCYLSSLRFTDNVVSTDNMVSDFLENEWPPDIIWLFADMFDFKHILLSHNAIAKLITYVSEMCYAFPNESRMILESFLDYAFENVEQRFQEFSSSIAAILILIQQKFIAVQGHSNNEHRFVSESPEFSIWKRLLICVYKAQGYWPFLADQMIRFLHFGLWNRHPSLDERLSRFLDLTLFVFLGLFHALPYVVNPSLSCDLNLIYTQHPHPLNGRNRTLDQRVLEITKKCYDVEDEEMFAEIFFKLRNLILSNEEEIDVRVAMLEKMSSFASNEAFHFLVDSTVEHLSCVCDEGIVTWFLQLFDGKTFTISQEVILSMFLSDVWRGRHMLKMAKASALKTFVSDFKYPFFFPKEILEKADVVIDAGDIAEYPLEILQLCLDNIARCSKCVIDVSQLLIPLIEPFSTNNKANFMEFVQPKIEPVHYQRALCWYVAFRCNDILDVRRYQDTVIMYLRTGSPRLARTLLLSIEAATASHSVSFNPILKALMDIIGEFLLTCESPFCYKTDNKVFEVAGCIFTMIGSLRRMIKTQEFRDFITKYTNVDDMRSVIAVMAVLNNSIDVFRTHVHGYAIDENGVTHEGEIEEMKSTTMKINGHSFSPSKCRDLWVVPEFVDLELFSDYSVFVSMFEHCSFEQDYQNVFMEASLNAFLKVPRFLQAMSPDLKAKVESFECTTNILPPMALYDFSYFFCISHLKFQKFDILDVQEESLTADGENPDGVVTGYLFSTTEPKQFSTCPLSPFCYTKITFESNSYLSVELFCVTGTQGVKFVIDNISLNQAGTVTIEIIPSRRIVKWYCSGTEKEASLSPSCKMIYMILHVAYASVVSYQFESHINTDWPVDGDFVSRPNVHLTSDRDLMPSIDSSWFNKVSLAYASHRIVDWIRSMNKIEILMRTSRQLENPLHLLFLTNQNPMEQTISFRDMSCSTVWMLDSKAVRDYLLRNLPTIQSLELEVMKWLKQPKLVSPNNMSAMHMSKGLSLTLSNCFVVDANTVRITGSEPTTIEAQQESVVLPFNDVSNSILETKVIVRHLLAICLMQHNRPSQDIISAVSSHAVLSSLSHLAETVFGETEKCPLFVPIALKYERPDLEGWGSLQTCQVHLCDKAERLDLLPVAAAFPSEAVKFARDQLDSSYLDMYKRFVDVWDKPIDYGVCVSKDSKQTQERVEFLQRYSLNLFEKIDPWLLHIVPAFTKLTESLRKFQQNPQTFLSVRHCNRQTVELLCNFVRECPLVTLLLLIDLVCGCSEEPHFLVVDVPESNEIKFFKPESLLVLGNFTEQSAFNNKMLTEINESYASQCI